MKSTVERQKLFTTARDIRFAGVRIGAVVIVLFLVQIMVSLSRYNTRLAGYYDARADAILLQGETDTNIAGVKFEDLVSAMSPDDVDFGRAPRTLLEQAMNFARDTARRGSGRTGSG